MNSFVCFINNYESFYVPDTVLVSGGEAMNKNKPILDPGVYSQER